MTKTYLPKVSEIKRQWQEIDASQFTLGRLATRVATILRGKHKATYTPHMDLGDFVVITNAKRIKLTGRKLSQKKYHHYSGYPGGLRTRTMKELMEKNPGRVIWAAVFNMLDSNRLRRSAMRRLKIVEEGTHNFKIDKKITK